jgi:DNA-binding transcriptional LysR family regulator
MPRRAYKEIQLQQLRSFCETARLGSLMAAAESLGLSQPTVCEQVHALERAMELKLVERHRHGCRATEAGKLVAELAAPLVGGINTLKRTVHEALGQVETWVTVAATQRVLLDDMPQVVVEFERLYPNVRLRLLEMQHGQVTEAIETGEADLGLSLEKGIDPPRPTLIFEPGYDLHHYLVTPPDHPLAKRRTLKLEDLAEYPLVNSPRSFPNRVMKAALEEAGVFKKPRRVEAFYAAVTRRYVELGYGIGLVLGLPDRPQTTNGLHERSMAKLVAPETIHLVRRKTELPNEPLRALMRTIASVLSGKKQPVEA